MNVHLFITCLTDTFFPRVGKALVCTLQHFGCTVSFPPDQTCCGQPAYNSGFHTDAARLVRHMARAFPDDDAPIVAPSASCTALVQAHARELVAAGADADRVRRLVARTVEGNVFLRDRLGVDVGPLLRVAEPVTFHYPCHARSIYTLADLQHWLRALDVRTPARPDLCCGFGGIFAVDYPELSGAMLGDKLDQLAATGANLVISNEAACTLQMAGGARRRGLDLRFKHLAECLAESLGLMEPAA
jgi:L-lactate dehydrogenase complex protein LldE